MSCRTLAREGAGVTVEVVNGLEQQELVLPVAAVLRADDAAVLAQLEEPRLAVRLGVEVVQARLCHVVLVLTCFGGLEQLAVVGQVEGGQCVVVAVRADVAGLAQLCLEQERRRQFVVVAVRGLSEQE